MAKSDALEGRRGVNLEVPMRGTKIESGGQKITRQSSPDAL